MKIAMITPMLRYSGAPKMFAWLANQLSETYEVTLIIIFESEVMQRLNPGITVIKLEQNSKVVGRIRKLISFFKVEITLGHVVNEGDYEAVLTFGDMYTIALLRRWTRRGISTVVCERGDPSSYSPVFFKMRQYCFGHADKVVFQTEGAQQGYFGTTGYHSVIIPNPVIQRQDLTLYDFHSRKREIVTVGRLEIRSKRQDVLIRSFAKMIYENNSLSDYTLVIYGDGTDKERLTELTMQLGIANSVKFAGVISDVENTIKDASLFVFTSEHEGIPNAIVEAMTVGLPIIATDCKPGGAKLLVRDGIDGFIVPINDEMAICEKMKLVLCDEGLRKRLGTNALQITTRFSEEKIRNQWREMFR